MLEPAAGVAASGARDDALAWSSLLAARRWRGPAPPDGAHFVAGAEGRLAPTRAARVTPSLRWHAGHGWRPDDAWSSEGASLLDLYLPLCTVRAHGAGLTVGHLGQSLDGHIAMGSGEACYVTGPANITHLHRMRALCDAVVVGATTVASDDPRLTTRQVRGEHAVRVVLDPALRLDVAHRLFTDGEAPTLVLHDRAARRSAGRFRGGAAEAIGIGGSDGELDLVEVLDVLHARGLHTVFVEGGGVTVSKMLAAGLLDRLQVTVAPLIIGDGRPGLRLAAPASLDQCPRPPTRIFRMGADVLFDCDLRADERAASWAGEGVERVL